MKIPRFEAQLNSQGGKPHVTPITLRLDDYGPGKPFRKNKPNG